MNVLFVMAAVGGLWSDVFRCDQCGRFNVGKKHASMGHRFCVGTDVCRNAFRNVQHEAERREQYDKLKAQLDQGKEWLAACRVLHRTSRYCEALVQQFEGERGRGDPP